MQDSAPSLQSQASRRLRGILLGIGVLAIVAYSFIIATHISPHASSSDASGYFNSARLLSQGEFFAPARSLPDYPAKEFGEMAFQPLGFHILQKTDQLAPTYPIGFPLHLLAASWIVGWEHAAIAVNLLAVLASGALLWILARQLGLSEIWATICVVSLALCPLFLFSALQPMSDLLALAWSLAVLCSALRARTHFAWAVTCGVAIGLAVLIRPTNALLIIPILVAVGFRWKQLFAVALGGLPGAAIFAFYNWREYGSPFVTGYGDISSIFGPRFLSHNLVHFGHWIPALLSPVIVLALIAPFLNQTRRREYAVIGSWFLAVTGFYVLYFHSGETWWYLRFILPAFPILILEAITVVAAAIHAAKLRAGASVAAIACVGLFIGIWEIRLTRRFEVMTLSEGESNYPDAAHWAEKNLPPNSAIFCMQVSGAFYYYSDLLLIRWEQIDKGKYDPLLAALAEQQRPVYAALFAFETPDALNRIGGHWIKLNTIGQVTFWQRQS